MKKKSVMMMFCLILVLALTGCLSKKETNDQSNQKGTAIYYTNNDVTKLILKRKYQIKRQSDSESSDVIRRTSEDAKESEHTVCYTKENCDQQF